MDKEFQDLSPGTTGKPFIDATSRNRAMERGVPKGSQVSNSLENASIFFVSMDKGAAGSPYNNTNSAQ